METDDIKPPKRICGAKNRQGRPCQKRPMIGRERCKNHGGAIPKSQNAGKANGNYKHGLYTDHLSDEERASWQAIPIGDVENEIRMCRVLLNRCLAVDSPRNPTGPGLELAEVRRSERGGEAAIDSISRRPDAMGKINWLLGRVALLEKTRTELQAAAAGKEDLTVRYVVEMPADEAMSDWLKNYGKTE